MIRRKGAVDMGYFSSLAIDLSARCYDHSVTTPEQQLLWRLDDLRDRLDEIKSTGGLYGGVCSYTKNDLRYVLPGCFHTVYELELAIELAIDDLKNKYCIQISEEEAEETVTDELTGSQLSLDEIAHFYILQTAA